MASRQICRHFEYYNKTTSYRLVFVRSTYEAMLIVQECHSEVTVVKISHYDFDRIGCTVIQVMHVASDSVSCFFCVGGQRHIHSCDEHV